MKHLANSLVRQKLFETKKIKRNQSRIKVLNKQKIIIKVLGSFYKLIRTCDICYLHEKGKFSRHYFLLSNNQAVEIESYKATVLKLTKKEKLTYLLSDEVPSLIAIVVPS